MPTYEYECLSCKEQFEVFQRMSDRPISKCPKCRKRVRRLISGGAGVLFKGSGFYETDYRSADYKQKAKADQDAAKPTPPKKTEGSSDSSSKKKSD